MATLKRISRVSAHTHTKMGANEMRKVNLQTLLTELDRMYEKEVVRLRLLRKDVITKFQKSRP